MPPKLPFKRRLRDEDDRLPGPHKKHGKRKEPTYETYDDAFDGGVEMEEKGERYRDGEKARRFYEKAAELYQKASQFDETYDATYNLARVHFILASNFLLPPSSLDTYGSSIALFRKACALTLDPSSSLSNNSPNLSLHIDACFNLAQACNALADATEESQGEWAETGVMELRDAARIYFEQTLVRQEEFLTAAREGEGEEEGMIAEEAEAQMGRETQGEGVQVAAQDGGEGDGAVAEGIVPNEGEKQEMTVDEDEDGEEGDDDDDDDIVNLDPASPLRSVFEIHQPTPSALVDTALALISVHLSIWESSSSPPSEDSQTMVHSILALASSHTPPSRQPELDLAEINILLTQDRIVWRLFRNEARTGTGVERSLEGASNALMSLYNSLERGGEGVERVDGSVKGEILTMWAEAHMGVAARVAYVARLEASEAARARSQQAGTQVSSNTTRADTNSAAGQQAWAHCASAVEVLNKIIAMPNSGLPTLLKIDTNLSLSKVSLQRCRLADISNAAAQNVTQLLENAVTYAARAADGLGWKFARLDSSATPIGSNSSIPAPDLPEPAGWDAELLARNVILHQLRIGFYARKLAPTLVAAGANADAAVAITERASILLQRVVAIQLAERKLNVRDVERWVEDLEDEEGALPVDEKDWWMGLFENGEEANVENIMA